jgi:hypothetical protein
VARQSAVAAAPTGLFGAILEPVLKASIAYVPASLIVCGALASLGQRALFGLSLDSFEVNAALATGLDFFANVGGDILEYVLNAGWIAYATGMAFVVVATLLMRWRRIFAIRALIVVILAMTLWRIWSIDLPATFLSNVFSVDPRVLVQSNYPGKRMTARAEGLWHTVVCQYVPAGIGAEKGPKGDVTRPAIACDPAAFGLDPYKAALLVALVTTVVGLIVITLHPPDSTASVHRGFLVALITYQLLATPFLYGRLKMEHDFPEVDLYLRATKAELPLDVAPFEFDDPKRGRGPAAREQAKAPWPWLHAYILERKDKSLTLLVPVMSSCATFWRRIELSSSDITLVRSREFKQDQKNSLFAQFLRAPRTCAFEAPPPL